MFGPSVGMDAGRGASGLPRVAAPRPIILLPTLNEEAGLAKTLAELTRVTTFSEGRVPQLLVVDGHSTDHTLDVARQYSCTILTQQGRGKGAAIREGLAWAREHHFGYVGVLDADATYPSERLPALFRLLSLGADVVVGLRRPNYASGRTARDLVHRVGNGGLNLCAALFSRGPVLDVCSGFWGLRTSILPRLGLVSDGFEIESELFVKSFRLGLHVVQIPVTYRERTGVAKLQAGRDGARILLSIIRQSHAATQLVPPPRRAPARTAPRPRNLSAIVLALALTLDPTRVRITSPASRQSDATVIASRLAASWIGVDMITDGTVRIFPPGPHDGPPADEGDPRGDRSTPLEVSLLDDAPAGGRYSPSAVVALPRSRHYLRLGVRGVSVPPASEATILRRSSRIARVPGVVQILSATLDSSGVQKAIALLAANFSATGLEVHTPGGRSALPVSSVGSVGPDPVRSGLHVGQRW